MAHKIIAKTTFNARIAVVLDKRPELVYQKRGVYIWGTDGIFYQCYKNEGMGRTWKAFAGREFTITLEGGEVIECKGQWWDAGQREVEKILGITLGCATVGTIESLKRCYVYAGYTVDVQKYRNLLEKYSHLPVIDNRDYEKIIRYDDMRSDYIHRIVKLERANKNLKIAVKDKHAKLKEFVNA